MTHLYDDDHPRHQKRASKHKPFGIKIRYISLWLKREFTHCRWYATEKGRDRAFRDLFRLKIVLQRKRDYIIEKVER